MSTLLLILPSRHNAPSGTSENATAHAAPIAIREREGVFGLYPARVAFGLSGDEGESLPALRPRFCTPRHGGPVVLNFVAGFRHQSPTAAGRHASVWAALERTDAEPPA